MLLKILSVICTIPAVIICLCSLRFVEAGQDNCMGGIDVMLGVFGFLISLPFALTGLLTGISLTTPLIRKNKASSDTKWAITVLVICGIVFLIALFGTMKHWYIFK